MTKRTILAGTLGGLAMYVWASLAHVVLPLGQTGISEIPNETALIAGMHSTLGQSQGLYLFPGMGGNSDMKAYEAKLAASPSGILVYNPPGAPGMTPARLLIEFLTEMLEAVLLAWLMAHSRMKSFGSRVGFALAVGVVAGITTNVSYWNWYHFPSSYTAA